MWLIKELSESKSVKIVTDQVSSPTLADNLAETLLKLSKTEKVGIYHISGRSRLSRYDFSVRISHKMYLDEDLISPITTDQLTQKAKRPMDSSLNVKKVEKHLNLNMLTIEQALNQFSNQAIVGEDK